MLPNYDKVTRADVTLPVGREGRDEVEAAQRAAGRHIQPSDAIRCSCSNELPDVPEHEHDFIDYLGTGRLSTPRRRAELRGHLDEGAGPHRKENALGNLPCTESVLQLPGIRRETSA